MNDYYQGGSRHVIQIHRWRGDWMVWNWRTKEWDIKPAPLNEQGR